MKLLKKQKLFRKKSLSIYCVLLLLLSACGAQKDNVEGSAASDEAGSEASSFFQGQKTVDEVSAAIQNQVQLYLDEMG